MDDFWDYGKNRPQKCFSYSKDAAVGILCVLEHFLGLFACQTSNIPWKNDFVSQNLPFCALCFFRHWAYCYSSPVKQTVHKPMLCHTHHLLVYHQKFFWFFFLSPPTPQHPCEFFGGGRSFLSPLDELWEKHYEHCSGLLQAVSLLKMAKCKLAVGKIPDSFLFYS